jgi:protein-tyrosine phosphatase
VSAVGDARSPDAGFFGILAVCTGNVCRSPAVERLLQHRLDRLTPWTIALGSAGTAAQRGQPVHPLTARALASIGVDTSGHVAKSVVEDYLVQADLILAATRAHRIPLVGLHPMARWRIFTVTEFARLAAAAAPKARDPWELVTAASALRGEVLPVFPGDDDLADPIHGTYANHQATVARIDVAVRSIADVFAALAPAHAGAHARPAEPYG